MKAYAWYENFVIKYLTDDGILYVTKSEFRKYPPRELSEHDIVWVKNSKDEQLRLAKENYEENNFCEFEGKCN